MKAVEMSGKAVRKTFELALRDSGATAGVQVPASGYVHSQKFVLNLQIQSRACRHFPVVSGFRVEWNSTWPAMGRVEHVWLVDGHGNETLLKDTEDDKYNILTNSYLASGGGGFTTFGEAKKLEYEGLPMYQVLRGHLGKQYILGLLKTC